MHMGMIVTVAAMGVNHRDIASLEDLTPVSAVS
jgi:hypothetical protein